ncbi:hypothetical protein [Flavobacterium sp. WV_118_3]|uniref:hypothetical protein n=1 Tax=Flavobacterium sp. WV_118_3 TaxID=3151764 RepID=UPI003219928C
MKKDNFYEVKKIDYNWTPIKLLDTQKNVSTIEILKNNQIIKTTGAIFREISISKIHLERIGFENDSLNDVFAVPIYMILGEDLMNLTSAYFGYLIFHKDEIVNIQKTYNSVLTEVYETFKTNPEIISDSDNVIKQKFNSIFNVNDLFKRLAEYNIIVENKSEILIG